MLSTPPAFILSQDQTLELRFSEGKSMLLENSFSRRFLLHWSGRINILAYSSVIYLCLGFVPKIHCKNFRGWNILFCYQGSMFCFCFSAATFIGYHIFRCLSTTFLLFFKKFFKLFSSWLSFPFGSQPQRWPSYHYYFDLSTPFFNFFRSLFFHIFRFHWAKNDTTFARKWYRLLIKFTLDQ